VKAVMFSIFKKLNKKGATPAGHPEEKKILRRVSASSFKGSSKGVPSVLRNNFIRVRILIQPFRRIRIRIKLLR
jgi:hypothetical protein